MARGRLEGAQRVLVIGCDENHRRHLINSNCLQYSETVKLWHLDIEKHKVRRLFLNGRNSL